MKIISLIKAAFSQDMSLFKYSAKRNSSKFKKMLLPLILFLIVATSIGSYAQLMAEQLAPMHLTYIMLTMFMLLVNIITFMEGIYKSQGILFDAKDNNLLFSLPIKKSQILFIRILKLIVFQILYNLMFLLPAFIVYSYYEHPSLSFYLISVLFTILVPIIPTVFSACLGYFIKLLSSKSKSKKIVQTLLSFAVFVGIMYLSFQLENFIGQLAEKATNINDMITNIYYPIGLYINLITDFQIIDLIKLILINLIPFSIFIYIGSKFYFGIISKNSETSSSKKKVNNKKEIIIQRKPINALVLKEFKRYISSPVYMFNTSFGLLLSVGMTVVLCIKGQSILNQLFELDELGINISLPVIYYFMIICMGAMTSISSSSISLENKTINITKSLPINEKRILKSKVLVCFLIELPFLLFASFLFIIAFRPNFLYSFLILGSTFGIILLTSSLGLLINLKYPKMDASNDTEVIKQSMSSMLSVLSGFIIFIIGLVLVEGLVVFIPLDLLLVAHFILLIIIAIILYAILMKKGPKAYRNINV